MIWPRAHAKLFPLYKRQHSREREDVENPDGAWGLGSPSAVMKQCTKDIQPVDCYGPAGTCIFWHHRGMHGPGVNHSDRMRLAVLHEWVRKDVNDGPPPADMWRDWSEEVRTCPDHSGVGAHPVGADAKL